jgi:hypothetical protein
MTNECIHCEHSCHCDMMCSFHDGKDMCRCDECNCRPPDWGEMTIDME